MSTTTAEKPRGKAKAKKTKRANAVITEMVGIGKRLLQARTLKGMTQDDLAAKVKTSTQDIGQLENGWRSISVPRAYLIAKALGVTGEWLITGINPKTYAALVVGAKQGEKALKQLHESGEHSAGE